MTRYALVDPSGQVVGIWFGPDGAASTTDAEQVIASDTANPGDTYANGVFTPEAAQE